MLKKILTVALISYSLLMPALADPLIRYGSIHQVEIGLDSGGIELELASGERRHLFFGPSTDGLTPEEQEVQGRYGRMPSILDVGSQVRVYTNADHFLLGYRIQQRAPRLWALILCSIPEAQAQKSDLEGFRRAAMNRLYEASGRKLALGAEELRSADFKTLRPGYRIIAMAFSSHAEAKHALTRARAHGYPDASIRRLW